LENHSNNSKLMSNINVTPLVDVMLVLLIIFMVTSPMMIQSIDVNLPETKTAVAKTSEDPVTLTVDKNGIIYIDDKKLEKSNIKSFLENLFKYRKNKEVIVRADKSVPYGNVVELLDMLREIGITKIGMVTRSKD